MTELSASLSSPRRASRLGRKVLLASIPFLVIAILGTSALLSWMNQRYFLKTIEADYRNILKSSAGEIRLYMVNAQKGMEALAMAMAATRLDRWQQEMALTAFNLVATQFLSVGLLTPDGRIITATGQPEEDLDYSKDAAFQEALAGRIAVSPVLRTPQNVPFVRLAVPLLHLGEVTEVLWGVLNLKSVWDVLEGISVGRTGEVYLMDAAGRLVGHRDMSRVINVQSGAGANVLQRLQDEQSTPIAWTEERDGGKFFCLGSRISDLSWIIVLSQQHSETYVYFYENLRWAVILTVFLCLVAAILAHSGTARLLRPVEELHRQVLRMGGGDLDQKVTVRTRDEIGELGSAFNAMTDSLQKFIAQEVENARELTHARNLAVLGTTSSKVAHEVGNLLNNLGAMLLTIKVGLSGPEATTAIEIMEKDAARVRVFIKNFLQFAKKPELHLERTSLLEPLQELLFTHRPEAEQRQIQLELEWPSDLPPVFVDAGQLNQVLNNLVKNSLEAMDDGGLIRIAGRKEEDRLRIVVSDTGGGMAPQVLEHIFDPFFTTKGKKGTGLGLPICKTIVEAHRGTISCRSEPGKGTEFIVSIPLL